MCKGKCMCGIKKKTSIPSSMSDAPSIQDNLVRTHRMVHEQDKINL